MKFFQRHKKKTGAAAVTTSAAVSHLLAVRDYLVRLMQWARRVQAVALDTGKLLHEPGGSEEWLKALCFQCLKLEAAARELEEMTPPVELLEPHSLYRQGARKVLAAAESIADNPANAETIKAAVSEFIEATNICGRASDQLAEFCTGLASQLTGKNIDIPGSQGER